MPFSLRDDSMRPLLECPEFLQYTTECLNIVEPCRFMLNLRREGLIRVDGGNKEGVGGQLWYVFSVSHQ